MTNPTNYPKMLWCALLIIGLCLLNFSPMEASLYPPGTFDLTTIVTEMTVDATHIIVGKVTYVSFVNDDSLSLVKVRVYKDMKAEIDRVDNQETDPLKGQTSTEGHKTPPKTVTFVQVGGPYPLIESLPFIKGGWVTAAGIRVLKRGDYVFLRLQPTNYPVRHNGKTVNSCTQERGTMYSVRAEGAELDKHIIERGWLGMDVAVSQMTRIVRATLKQPERMLALARHVKGLGRMPFVRDEKGRVRRLQPDTRLPIVMAEVERIEAGLNPSPLAGGAREKSEEPEELTFELVKEIKFADGTEVKLIAQSDIDALRDKPIYVWKKNDTDSVTLTKGKNKVIVRTCREYDAALEAGYSPYSGYEVAMASWFKYPCKTLRLLESATIPKHSFIPAVKEGLFDLALLPLMLFPVMSDYEQTYGYNIENETYQDRVDKGLMKVTEMSQSKLVCEDDGLRQHLTEVTRADFNGDGIEDILLFEAIYATQGSHRFFDLIILTRKSTDGKFEEIDLQEGDEDNGGKDD